MPPPVVLPPILFSIPVICDLSSISLAIRYLNPSCSPTCLSCFFFLWCSAFYSLCRIIVRSPRSLLELCSHFRYAFHLLKLSSLFLLLCCFPAFLLRHVSFLFSLLSVYLCCLFTFASFLSLSCSISFPFSLLAYLSSLMCLLSFDHLLLPSSLCCSFRFILLVFTFPSSLSSFPLSLHLLFIVPVFHISPLLIPLHVVPLTWLVLPFLFIVPVFCFSLYLSYLSLLSMLFSLPLFYLLLLLLSPIVLLLLFNCSPIDL